MVRPFYRRQHQPRPKFHLFSTEISISDAYDGGNIEVVRIEDCDDDDVSTQVVFLNIKDDPFTELEGKHHKQYFSFRSLVSTHDDNNSNQRIKYVIENASEASYAVAWPESTIFYGSNLNDPYSWRRRLDTTYDEESGQLSWIHDHGDMSSGAVYFCYFPPYSYTRHLQLIEKCCLQSSSMVSSLGKSLDGRDIECIQVGSGDRVAYIIHRQHPGEHMAEFFAEGLLERLLGFDMDDATTSENTNDKDTRRVVEEVLSKYTFYIIPNMNPDGAVRGHLRTNACGANLNREWAPTEDYDAPTLERSPEVHHVLAKMRETGCDIFLDIHGDEGLPYNFLAQPATPNWGERLESLHGAFLAAYQRANSDMQEKYAYEPMDEPSEVLNIANDQIAQRFDCLSITLEMPFKDCLSNPDPHFGWNPSRSKKLGASVLEALNYIHPYLRAKGEFWQDLPPEDAYVRPTSDYK